jgi:hypothetical protein
MVFSWEAVKVTTKPNVVIEMIARDYWWRSFL